MILLQDTATSIIYAVGVSLLGVPNNSPSSGTPTPLVVTDSGGGFWTVGLTSKYFTVTPSAGPATLRVVLDSNGNQWQLGVAAGYLIAKLIVAPPVPPTGIPVLSQYGSGAWGNPPIEALSVDYYLNLITWEYRNSPKFLAWLRVLLKKLDDVSQCLISMDTAFDVDNAIGVQLDACGAIAGASRTVGFQPSGGASPVLDDPTYRLLIKAQIAQNQWDGTIDGLQTIWGTLFPTGSIAIGDNQNMTATIFLTGTFTSIEKDLILNGYIVPRPQAVLYNFAFNLPAFGCDLRNAFVAGADQGYTT